MDELKEIKTLCAMCIWGCGIIVSVKEGIIVKVKGDPDHPWNRGRLCPKAAYLIEQFYSARRITHPIKKVGGKWERLTWDDALDTMALQLNKIKKNYGPEAWAMVTGMGMIGQGFQNKHFLQRFCDVYGSPNFIAPETVCFLSRITANILTFGMFPFADPRNSQCVVLWGNNPSASDQMAAEDVKWAKSQGAKIIVIDPRKTYFAKEADIYTPIRPGTDCALALSLLRVIIEEELYDKPFVEKWTAGFDQLRAHVKEFTLDRGAAITGIPAKIIESIARNYASSKPAVILQGTNSLDQHPTGFQNNRALAILEAITGNIDVTGGHLIAGPPPNFTPLRLPELVKKKGIGKDQFPLFVGDWTCQGMLIPDMILTGKPHPIKALTIVASNPILVWPNSQKMKKALANLEFLSVTTLTMNETAEMADLVLPAAGCLERTEITEVALLGAKGYMSLRNKVADYQECWSDVKIFLNLAKRMGYENYFPWRDEGEVLQHIFKDTGININDYLGKTNFIKYGEVKYKSYETSGFPTASGKVELYSTVMAQFGLDPLPSFVEPPESPVSSPDVAKDYPVILTTGARILQYIHTSSSEVAVFDKKFPGPFAEIHPRTAGDYGIGDGEAMIVETRRGAIEVEARVTEDIMPQVVSIPHGWSQGNVNVLTDETPADPVTGYPALKALLCRIRPAKGG
ncbi:MAG TPA: molybdopterin oxidoreductase family protein [Syntrophales bacterium]|nr:molybdopterin oxidoreductase family protein [Syntrophales bacterium]